MNVASSKPNPRVLLDPKKNAEVVQSQLRSKWKLYVIRDIWIHLWGLDSTEGVLWVMKLLCKVAMNLLIKLQNVAWEQTLLFLWIISPSKFITWQQLIWHTACLAGAWICPLDIKKNPYQCHSAGMKWDGHKSKNLQLCCILGMVLFISLLFVALFGVQQSVLTAWRNKQQYIHFAIRWQSKTHPLQQTHVYLQIVQLPFRELLTLRENISLGKCLEDGRRNKVHKQDLSQSCREGCQQKQQAPVSC